MKTVIDHLVVVAPTLDSGVEAVESELGITLAKGGKHPAMGTHNRLLKLGDTTYLEVIAPDPEAPHPPGSRWFGLDRLSSNDSPRLAGWVARTDDIHRAGELYQSTLGSAAPMSRGNLKWQITIRPDGELPFHGAAPVLIEWESEPHPARTLPDSGCSLSELRIFHPDPETVRGMCIALELESMPKLYWAAGMSTSLIAYINTPDGRRTLGVEAVE